MTFFAGSFIVILTEPATPLVPPCATRRDFYLVRCLLMKSYPKRILTIPQQLRSYTDAGMTISSVEEAMAALTTIGYYRLRGYSYQLYDNASRQYRPGTDFSDILKLYRFDTELSGLLFGMATCIEVALRVRLSDALLAYSDALVLMDPAVFPIKNCSGRTCLPFPLRSHVQMMCSYAITFKTMMARSLYGPLLRSCRLVRSPKPSRI